jgi:hypothetical protein
MFIGKTRDMRGGRWCGKAEDDDGGTVAARESGRLSEAAAAGQRVTRP